MKHGRILNLFDLYADDLFRFAVSYVGSKQEAEDIVQNVFLKLLSKRLFINAEYEKPYLLKMTANMCKDYLKSKKITATANYDEIIENTNGITDNSFISDERQLYDNLMKLPDIQRIPIYLHFYEGYTYKEIAKILKISESAVAMRISRGKDELKRRLED